MGALTAMAHAQTFEVVLQSTHVVAIARLKRCTAEGTSLASLSSKLTSAWTSVEGGRKEGTHKQKGDTQTLKGGAAPCYDALAKALIHLCVPHPVLLSVDMLADTCTGTVKHTSWREGRG